MDGILTDEQIAEMAEQAKRAHKHLCDICTKRDRFRMTIPRRDDDSDSLFGDACRNVETLAGALVAEREQAAKDRATINRLDNLVLEQGKRVKELEQALATRTMMFEVTERKLNEQIDKTCNAEVRLTRLKGFCTVYDQSRMALGMFEAESIHGIEDAFDVAKTDPTPTDTPINGDGGD